MSISTIRVLCRGWHRTVEQCVPRSGVSALLLAFFTTMSSASYGQGLSVREAVDIAIAQDPWLLANAAQEHALLARGEAAQVLPDPKLSVGMANLPVDSFDLRQEPMTQLNVTLSQAFPAGNSLDLRGQRYQTMASKNQYAADNRKAQIQQAVSRIWADLYRYDETLTVLNQTRGLLESLQEATGSGYSSAFGRVKQQDLVLSDLELGKIEEKVFQVKQAALQTRQQLTQYLPQQPLETDYSTAQMDGYLAQQVGSFEDVSLLVKHPSVQILDVQVAAAELDKAIAQEQYKPEWALNLGYGYRGNDLNGRDRADLASVSVSVSLPFFSDTRNDAQVRSAAMAADAVTYDRQLKLNELSAQFRAALSDIALLNQRIELYQSSLLPGYQHSAEAVMNAYAANESSYRDVIIARVAQMNAQVDLIQIKANRFKRLAELRYLMTQSTEEVKP